MQPQVDARTAAGASVHIGLCGQGQAVAAEVDIVLSGRGIVAIRTERVLAGSQGSIELIVVAVLVARCGVQCVGKSAVQKLDALVQAGIDAILPINVGVAIFTDVIGTLRIEALSLVKLDERINIAVGGVIHILANIEGVILRSSCSYIQSQRPSVRRIAVGIGRMEFIDICTGGILRDLDGGAAEQSRSEIVGAGPGISNRSIIIVVGVVQRCAVRILEDITGLQVGEIVSIASRYRIACSRGHTFLQSRDLLVGICYSQGDGVGSRSSIIGSGQHHRVSPRSSGGVTQNRAVQRLSNAVDSRRVGQRITFSIGKHISQIQRPRITKCYIGCGDCIGSDRRGRVAFIGEGEEVDGRIAGAAVILRRIGSSATICTQHKALLDRGPILGGTGVVQGNCDCDIPIALRIGHFYTAASPLRHIGVVAGCFTARGIGQYGSVFVGGLYIGRACGNGDQVVGHILESRVAGKGHRVLHTDSCRSCGLVIRTIGNNTIQRRSYCALFRCKNCRGKDGQNHHERKQH